MEEESMSVKRSYNYDSQITNFICRPCMLIPIIGELLTAIGLIVCTYFEGWPMEAAGVTEALFPGLAGEIQMAGRPSS